MNYNIIVAAGTGSRYGADLPKQFCLLGGRPLLMTTVERMRQLDSEATIILVLSPEMMPMWEDMCRRHSFSPEDVIIAEGGASRFESVRNALALIPESCGGWISVHDGARPVLSKRLIDTLIAARTEEGKSHSGVLPVIPVTDTLRRMTPDGSVVVDRNSYRRVQTPQLFPAQKLLRAYKEAVGCSFTDDASVMEAAGEQDILLVEGDPRNIKVTNPGDIAIAELYLKEII
ncbi:MAG: 2-C-methyl-D-erythritol 4-phosphate cytidylyltransferase [Lachnoclostridium sp.]|nr:2-C-methyl-D-erythritol 4-phosphate cytidylyltransferase [Lachnoclostridium sp.]